MRYLHAIYLLAEIICAPNARFEHPPSIATSHGPCAALLCMRVLRCMCRQDCVSLHSAFLVPKLAAL